MCWYRSHKAHYRHSTGTTKINPVINYKQKHTQKRKEQIICGVLFKVKENEKLFVS
jgi:hypothetical protein